MKGKPLEMGLLYDFYGEILTSKQRKVFELYYNEDFSLAEIAEQAGITRQGVRDCVKRAEQILFEMEHKFGLVHRFQQAATASGTCTPTAAVLPHPANTTTTSPAGENGDGNGNEDGNKDGDDARNLAAQAAQELRTLTALNTTTLHNAELAASITRLSQLFQQLFPELLSQAALAGCRHKL